MLKQAFDQGQRDAAERFMAQQIFLPTGPAPEAEAAARKMKKRKSLGTVSALSALAGV